MEVIEILKNEYLSIVFGGLAGIATAWLTQRIINKRGVFSYFVHHNKVGMSAEDPVFGNVSVTWNQNPIQHLYLSTIELKNESLNDYESVVIKTYTNDTKLLTESAHILNSPNVLELTDKYRGQIHVEPGQQPTELQYNLYHGQREYVIPVFNRGQAVNISYLNAANSDNVPTIWLSASIRGVKVKFRVPQNQIFGVSQPRAALVGGLIGLAALIPLVTFIENTWAVSLAALLYGYFVLVPGAYAIKTYRKLRESIGG